MDKVYIGLQWFTSGKPFSIFLIKVVNFFIKIVNFFCIKVNFFLYELKLFVNFFCCLSSSDVNHFAKMLTFFTVCQLTCELSINFFCLRHTMSKPNVNFDQFRGAAPARAACRAGRPRGDGHACRLPHVQHPDRGRPTCRRGARHRRLSAACSHKCP